MAREGLEERKERAMRFSDRFKWVWWAVAMGLVGFGLWLRRGSIVVGGGAFDVVLLAVGAALLLLPFYSELTILGLTMKQQVQEAKKDITEGIQSHLDALRMDLQNAISVSNRATAQVVMYPPPPDSQLPFVKQRIEETLKQYMKTLGFEGVEKPTPKPELPLDVHTAFASRYHIERELRRIWQSRFGDQTRRRPTTLYALVADLVEARLIPADIAGTLHEAMAVANPVIHGEPASEAKVAFLDDVAPSLLAVLRAIP